MDASSLKSSKRNAWMDDAIQLEELDDSLDYGVEPGSLAKYLGKIVDWHGEKTTLVMINDGSYALPIYLYCRCGKSRRKVYMQPGLHMGAWPYAYNIWGKYLCNVRDQEYVCDGCAGSRTLALTRYSTKS